MILRALTLSVLLAAGPWTPAKRAGDCISISFVGPRNHPIPTIWISDHDLGGGAANHFVNTFVVLEPAAYRAVSAGMAALHCARYPSTRLDPRKGRGASIDQRVAGRVTNICLVQGQPACTALSQVARTATSVGSALLAKRVSGMSGDVGC